jgi:hypothetical protein
MIGSMIWRGQATDSGTASRHRANVTTQAAGGAHRERTSRHHHDTARAINDGCPLLGAKADVRW